MSSPTDALSREEVVIAKLLDVVKHDWRFSLLAHTSDTAADAVHTIRALLARLSEVEKALNSIAEQKLASEMDEEVLEYADWEGGFEQCVNVARAVLQYKEPQG